MGSNLEAMAVQAAKVTYTYAMLVEKRGLSDASSIIEREIQNIIPNYQAKWNQNLAAAYSAHLKPEELRSLAVNGKQSAHVTKLISIQNAVGEDVKKTSSPILIELISKALLNATRAR